MKKYEQPFYEKWYEKKVYAAEVIFDLLFDVIPPVKSAVDIGCGIGTFLSVLKKKGVTEVAGIDGPWVSEEKLCIPNGDFRRHNLEELEALERRFDLAISLEVAEHLAPESATRFVKMLTGASDFVLFSAAIPFQGGMHHVNEQWPEYWALKFQEEGFVALDLIRPAIWNETMIPSWYKQNTLLFVSQSRLSDLSLKEGHSVERDFIPPALIHPDTFLGKMKKIDSLKGTWKLFKQALFKKRP